MTLKFLEGKKKFSKFPDLLVQNKRNRYFHQSILHWDARVYEPSGEFQCQAKLVKDGSIEQKVWSSQNRTFAPKLFMITDDASDPRENNTVPNTLNGSKISASMFCCVYR